MTPPTGSERDCEQAKLLMQEYSFDLLGFTAGELVAIWQERLDAEPTWIRAAVLEALYQGRYKAISVEQILQGWKRRGHPVRHFNSEFERVVFGPIDPTVSKYASLTPQRPSELMSPQLESQPNPSTPAITEPLAPPPDPASMAATTTADETTTREAAESANPLSEVGPPLESDAATIAPATSDQSDAALGSSAETADPQSEASMFSQPAPIEKFTPQPEPSEFYQRLQAVARHAD